MIRFSNLSSEDSGDLRMPAVRLAGAWVLAEPAAER